MYTKKLNIKIDLSNIDVNIDRQLNAQSYYIIPDKSIKYIKYNAAIHLLLNSNLIRRIDAEKAWVRLNKLINKNKIEIIL